MPQLINRQAVFLALDDDQGPQLVNSYAGIWYNLNGPLAQGYINNTLSFTNVTGSTFHFTFAGTQAWFYGAVRNTTYPQAVYSIDGASAGAQSPYIDSSNQVIYFQTPVLSSNTHTIFVNVTVASNNSPYFLDAILYMPLSGAVNSVVGTQTVMPTNPASTTSSSSKSNLGAILGGVFGGLAFLVALGLFAYFFMRRRRNQNYYFDEPNPRDVLGSEAEAEIQPFPHSPSPNMRQNSQFGAISGNELGSNTISNSDMYGPDAGANVALLSASPTTASFPSEIGSSSVGVRPISAKAAMLARQSQLSQQTLQHADSGIRFVQNATEEEPAEAVAVEVPPSYSAT